MKRYSFYDSDGHTINEEDKVNCREMPEGEWVKYEDVEDMKLDFESELRGLDN